MSIKLVAIDMDGTLLNSHHEISEKTKEIIKQKSDEGLTIVLASGRPLIGMIDFVEQLGLTNENDFIISYNGALAVNAKSKEPFVTHPLSHDDLLDLHQLALALGTHYHFQDLDAVYTPHKDINPYTVYESALTTMPLRYREIEEIPTDMIINKLMFIDEEPIISRVIKEIPQSFYDKYNIVRSMPFFLEFLNKEASKGITLANLAEKLGIKQEEVMAIGDNENDISMLEYAGIGVAMGNATEKTKASANKISLSNDEDGVAYALENWAN